jgi:hypothetical protein
MFKFWIIPVCNIVLSVGAVARADESCKKAIEDDTRDQIASDYECDVQGIRCIDGHVGRAFVSGTYIPGDQLFVRGVPGAPIHVRVFALQPCAAERLAGIKFSTGTVKNPDTLDQRGNKPQADHTADTAQKASDKVSKAQEEVRRQTDRAKQAKDSASTQLNTNQLCSADDAPCASSLDKIKRAFGSESDADQLSPLQRALDQLPPALQQREPIKRASEAYKATQVADIAIKAQVRALTQELGELEQKAPQLWDGLRPKLDALSSEANASRWTEVHGTLGDIRDKLDGQAWPGSVVVVHGHPIEVSVAEDSIPIPEGDDNRFLTVSVGNSSKQGDADRKLWPDTTLSVKVDHGVYHKEVGVMFAGVYNGNRDFTSTGKCPDSCSIAFQPMLVGTLFPFGRPNAKDEVSSLRGMAPGIQGGVNLDLTKISKAVSLGIVVEPVTGITISGGVMLYAQPVAAPEADGSQKTREKLLPYFGLGFTTDLYDSIKGAAGSSNDKGNAAKEKPEKPVKH